MAFRYWLLNRLGKYFFNESTWDSIMAWVGIIFLILLTLYLLFAGIFGLVEFFTQKKRGLQPTLTGRRLAPLSSCP
jgi:hypothetical protein